MCNLLYSIETHQRFDVALHWVVVTTQISHEAETWHDDVIIVRLAMVQTTENIKLNKWQESVFSASFISYLEMWFLHVVHEKSNKLMNVACRLEDASVVSQFLQHL